MFTRAIVRQPGNSFPDGITTSGLGTPDLEKGLLQHQNYCRALEHCGLSVTVLDADDRLPDSTFVEDTAVMVGNMAVLARPGVASRIGEVEAIRDTIRAAVGKVEEIVCPGTLDGGDICDADGHFFIGVSHRTNEAGARQLAALLCSAGYSSTFVDIRGLRGILHLKSGIAHLGDKDLVVWEEMAHLPQFRDYNVIRVPHEEHYAANCVRVNERVLVAHGFPNFCCRIAGAGYEPLVVDVSEFRKMDGGLSCLSLRF
ncbi:MAG: dimethylarginine dimethylaminohydrolase family protein [Terriglobales bacterium]